jgi:hypothetical protein
MNFMIDLNEIKNKLSNDAEQIQCIVSNNLIENSISFGNTQKPSFMQVKPLK